MPSDHFINDLVLIDDLAASSAKKGASIPRIIRPLSGIMVRHPSSGQRSFVGPTGRTAIKPKGNANDHCGDGHGDSAGNFGSADPASDSVKTGAPSP
jgi:hypothetical protein